MLPHFARSLLPRVVRATVRTSTVRATVRTVYVSPVVVLGSLNHVYRSYCTETEALHISDITTAPPLHHTEQPQNIKISAITKEILENFDRETALEALSQLNTSGEGRLNVILDEIVIQLLKEDKFSVALQLTKDIIENEMFHIEKDLTYTRLMKAFIARRIKNENNGDGIFKEFIEFIHFMDGYGYALGAPQHFQVLYMAALCGTSSLAQMCFDELEEDEKYRVGEIHHSLLLKSYMNEARKTGDYSNHGTIMQLFNEMVDDGMRLNERDMKLFIENSILSGSSTEATEAIKRLSDTKYLEYLDLLLKIEPFLTLGDLRAARQVSRKTNYHLDCERFITLNATVVAEARDNIIADLDNASLNKLQAEGCQYVASIANDVVRTLMKDDRLDETVAFTRHAVTSKVQVSSPIYQQLLKQFVKKKMASMDSNVEKECYSFIAFMKDNGYKTNAQQQFEILHMASLTGNGRLAKVCLNALIENEKYEVNNVHYGLFLKALVREARRTKDYTNQSAVLKCFEEIVESGKEVNSWNTKMFIENSLLSSMVDEGRQLITRITSGDTHEEYLDLLINVEPFWRNNDFRGARKLYKDSNYKPDFERLKVFYYN